jgi:phage terminase large subunit
MTRQFIPAKLEDNPTLEEADPGYRHRLAALPYRRRLMLLEGSWDVGYEGLVYAGFDTTVHVIDAAPIPSEWRRIRSIDFGYRNAMVVQWWAITPDDEMILYREIYETGLLTSELGPRIKELSVVETEDGIGAEDIEATVADHDADGRAELSRIHSMETVGARKAIEDGIQVVETRLKIDERGRSGIYIMRGATVRIDPLLESESKPTSTLDEFALYHRPKTAGDKAEKELPLDLNNHGMDAMRYAAQYLAHTDTIVFEPSGHRGIAGSFPT